MLPLVLLFGQALDGDPGAGCRGSWVVEVRVMEMARHTHGSGCWGRRQYREEGDELGFIRVKV